MAWKKWIVYCAAGEFLGMLAAAALAVAGNKWIGEPTGPGTRLLAFAIALCSGLAEGTCLSWWQWRVLGQVIPGLRWQDWWRPTVVAAVSGWALGILPSLFMHDSGAEPAVPVSEPPLLLVVAGAAAMGLVLGAGFGWVQSLALRRRVAGVRDWIWQNAAGWAVGMVLIFLAATLPDEHTPTGIILAGGMLGGALAGLSVGLATSGFVRRLETAGVS